VPLADWQRNGGETLVPHQAGRASQAANSGTSHALDEHSVVGVALAAIVLATINFEHLTALEARARNNT
jgi:hypothetical protein